MYGENQFPEVIRGYYNLNTTFGRRLNRLRTVLMRRLAQKRIHDAMQTCEWAIKLYKRSHIKVDVQWEAVLSTLNVIGT